MLSETGYRYRDSEFKLQGYRVRVFSGIFEVYGSWSSGLLVLRVLSS